MLMHLAKKEDYDKYEIKLNGKERKMKQLTHKDKILKHIELTKDMIPEMWGDPKMKPLTKVELDLILADEPEEVM